MPDMKEIFKNKADEYDLLVSCEDYNNNLLKTIIEKIEKPEEKTLVDFGTGTGRVARTFAPYFKHVYAFDASETMINKAVSISKEKGIKNISYYTGDHRKAPLEDKIADVIIEGWSFCCIRAWNENWKTEIEKTFKEVTRIIKENGQCFLIETLGTMTNGIDPPKLLEELYTYFEKVENFRKTVINTDYRFESVEEAARLCAFFFGDEIGSKILQNRLKIIPEYTGIWEKE